jgi:hypothetical protein
MNRDSKLAYLNKTQLEIVNQSIVVAEDVISDWYHLTISSWKKYRYDIRTLKDLGPDEIVPEVFAQIVRCERPVPPDGLRRGDFYRICLQDQNIIKALKREPSLQLLPLLTYVVTHELVHLVRFYKFFQFFDADQEQRDTEEYRVHQLTYEMLKNIKMPLMDTIFDYYAKHRGLVD